MPLQLLYALVEQALQRYDVEQYGVAEYLYQTGPSGRCCWPAPWSALGTASWSAAMFGSSGPRYASRLQGALRLCLSLTTAGREPS